MKMMKWKRWNFTPFLLLVLLLFLSLSPLRLLPLILTLFCFLAFLPLLLLHHSLSLRLLLLLNFPPFLTAPCSSNSRCPPHVVIILILIPIIIVLLLLLPVIRLKSRQWVNLVSMKIYLSLLLLHSLSPFHRLHCLLLFLLRIFLLVCCGHLLVHCLLSLHVFLHHHPLQQPREVQHLLWILVATITTVVALLAHGFKVDFPPMILL